MWKAVVILSVLCLSGVLGDPAPLFKVFCAGQPLFRGRADPIVSPGVVSNHVHRVAGASKFNVATTSATPLQVYNSLRSSTCSTCSIPVADYSAYWHPDLFYKWPNGTLSLVPSGGLTVYYEARRGNSGGPQANPTWTAFPPGFRMTAGNPFRRTYNASSLADNSITFACLPGSGSLPQTNGFPAPSNVCANGLRAQVYFPMCWDGVNLDTPDHQSHMAYPSGGDNGDCPAGFPKRVPGVFFEAFYSVSQFPQQSYQPFVLACGDSTGYGFHGDFLNGWNQTIMQNALNDVTCYENNTNEGNTDTNCNALKNYVTPTSNGACSLNHPIPLTEDLGTVYNIPQLPGCQAITGAGATASPCTSAPSTSFSAPLTQRFMLLSKSTGKLVTAPANSNTPLNANTVAAGSATTSEVFSPIAWASGSLTGVTFVSEAQAGDGIPGSWCSAAGTNGALECNRQSASTSSTSWEAFKFVPQSGGYIAILSYSNNKYVTVQSDGTLAPTSATIAGDAQLFTQQTPNGGYVNAVVY